MIYDYILKLKNVIILKQVLKRLFSSISKWIYMPNYVREV